VSFDPRLPRDDVNVSPTHPLAEAGWLIAAACALGLVLAVLAFGVTEGVARWLPAGLEARLFGGLFDSLGEEPGADEPPRAALARELLARLSARLPESPYALRLVVLDQREPNAFALPGGTIAVTQGLLDTAQSENELAFVLGHELGHFAARDHLRAIGRGLILSFVMRAALGVGAGQAAVPALASELASRGFARDQERDADAFALRLLAREYGHVAGADAFFRHLPDAKAGLADRSSAWLSTHPVSEERIAALAALAAREHMPATGPLRPLPGDRLGKGAGLGL
jgi:Zn-dependent protease with chaperone function